MTSRKNTPVIAVAQRADTRVRDAEHMYHSYLLFVFDMFYGQAETKETCMGQLCQLLDRRVVTC